MSDPVQNPYISNDSRGEGTGDTSLKELIRTGQIITFALAQGVLVITAILFFVMGEPADANPAAPNAMPPGNGDLVLPAIGIVAAIGACVIAFVLRGMLRRLAIRKYQATETQPKILTSQDSSLTPALGQLMRDSQTGTFVGQAILEGAAVINAVLMIVDDNLIYLAPIAILVVGIVIQCPTFGKRLQLAQEAGDAR